MDSISLSLLAVVPAAFIISLVLLFLSIFYRELFMAYWALGWALASIGLSSVFFHGLDVFYFYDSLMVLFGFLMFYGTSIFMDKKISNKWFYATILLIVLINTGALMNLPILFLKTPFVIFLVTIFFLMSQYYLKSRKGGSLGRNIAGWSFLLWGIHMISYAFYHDYVTLIPFALILASLTAQSGSLGMILHYFSVKNEELASSEIQFRQLAENSCDSIFYYRLKPPGFEYVSPSVSAILGYSPEDFYTDSELLAKVAFSPDRQAVEKYYSDDGPAIHSQIFRLKRKDGKVIWTEHRLSKIFDENGNTVAIESYVSDISERKEVEEKLEYLSLYDPVTELYNRNHFEREMVRIENAGYSSVCIIICDLDGLKLVNDTLGHKCGDKLLIEAARIIKSSFDKNNIVSRIGGDEFGIILVDVTDEEAVKARSEIEERISVYNRENPDLPLSISTGYALRKGDLPPLNELFKTADDDMYREKLARLEISRDLIIEAILKAHETKDFVNEKHVDYIKGLVLKMVETLNFSDKRTSDILLFARYHDIGKAGISNDILFKPQALNAEEKAEANRHCWIGYRIAQATPSLQGISDWILRHHEWWNGDGYPLGLRGEDIPFECRILTICDAYEVMTSERPYSKNLSHEQALTELHSKSGTQFDPYLVQLFSDLFKNYNKVI